MAQYLNPYEGIGNALINIGQNYDADRRQKKRDEEDQKRRRSDFKWQQDMETAEYDRRWKLGEPDREATRKYEALRAAKAQADLVKAQIEAQRPSITNLPGAGGSVVSTAQFDDAGNFTGVNTTREAYTPVPRTGTQTARGIIPGSGNLGVWQDGKIVDTGLLPPTGQRADGLTQAKLVDLKNAEFKLIQEIKNMSSKDLLGARATSGTNEEKAAAAEIIRQKRIKEIQDHYRGLRGEKEPEQAPARTGPGMLGSAASGALSLMGSLAGAVTPMTEQGVADDWQAGKIDAQQFADRMSRVGGGATHVSLTDPNTGKQEKADSKAVTSNNKKNDDKTEEVSYADAVAQVKALRPDLSQEDIDLYLRSKGITPPKNKK